MPEGVPVGEMPSERVYVAENWLAPTLALAELVRVLTPFCDF